jgi:hypothetical protein
MDVAMDADFAAKSLVQIGNLTNAPTKKVMLFAQLLLLKNRVDIAKNAATSSLIARNWPKRRSAKKTAPQK